MAIENYPSELSDSDTGSMSNSITPERTGIIGSTVLLATAVVTGVAHYISTTKPLMKDCITPEARLKAVPVALKALTASTMAVAGLGGMLLMSWKLFSGGRETKDSVAVSGLEEAIQYAEYQRVREFFGILSHLFGEI